MHRNITAVLFAIGLLIAIQAGQARAQDFTLTSPDIQEGQPLGEKQLGMVPTMGCEWPNLSPRLEWANAPEGTKSFAITVYDPDAPTGSGWWQWQIYNIPADVTSLPEGVGSSAPVPDGAVQGRNDGGYPVYGGACPPPGTGVHHYIFTVFALKVDKLPVPPEPSAAMIGAMLNMNTLAKAKTTATYER